jgi:TolA-binding protein
MSAYNQEPASARAVEAGARTRERGGRIQVEMGKQRAPVGMAGAQARALDRQATQVRVPLEREKEKPPSSHKLIWALVALTLMAASFYIGLRVSDWTAKESSIAAGRVAPPDPLRQGREAFDKGDYQSAMAVLDSLLKREPQNVEARYWLGRTQFELGQYQTAAQNLEEVTRTQPALRDAYLYGAAAHEAAGSHVKAVYMLAHYVKARNEQAAPNGSANVNANTR